MILQLQVQDFKTILKRIKSSGSDSFKDFLYFVKPEGSGSVLLFRDVLNELTYATFITEKDLEDNEIKQIVDQSFVCDVLDVYKDNTQVIVNAIESLKPSNIPTMKNNQQLQEENQNVQE